MQKPTMRPVLRNDDIPRTALFDQLNKPVAHLECITELRNS